MKKCGHTWWKKDSKHNKHKCVVPGKNHLGFHLCGCGLLKH